MAGSVPRGFVAYKRTPIFNQDSLPDRQGVIQTEQPHEVEPQGRVRFFIEFYRDGGRQPDGSIPHHAGRLPRSRPEMSNISPSRRENRYSVDRSGLNPDGPRATKCSSTKGNQPRHRPFRQGATAHRTRAPSKHKARAYECLVRT